MSNDVILTIGAATLEIGIPLISLISYYYKPFWRKRLIVLLGSLTPILLFYITFFFVLPWLPANRGLDPTETEGASRAIWVMSFADFAFSLFIGCILLIFNKPENLGKRFLLGFLPLLIIALEEIIRTHVL